MLKLGGATAEPLQEFFKGLVEPFVTRTGVPEAERVVLDRFASRLAYWLNARSDRYALLHNDYRLDNLLFSPQPSAHRPLTVVDWQTLSVGLPARDVAYLLATGLLPELRHDAERDLVAQYAHAMAAYAVPAADTSQAWSDYVFGLFQAPLILILGSMSSVPTDRGNEMFRVTTHRACEAIRDLDALDLLDD